ncbi:MAG: enolase C-terminal domain-like protein [Xanthomonadales bacterium]|nr:enolase C-terminal domain-like protein [Xanthomonadales bacterium]
MKIQEVIITPVAAPEVPLLNTKGVQQSVFTRSIIQIVTDTGITGLGETYGSKRTLAGLRKSADALIGLDPYHLNDLRKRVEQALPEGGGVNAPTAVADHQLVDVVFSAYEVACLDIQARDVGRPVFDLLGGAVRRLVPFSAYLFYKFKKLDGQPGEDRWGEVLTPDALVEEARILVGENGFRTLKLKGGVLEPDLEIETMHKLREAFPDSPLRLDPMGGWCVETAIRASRAMEGVLEYLEDPVLGMENMAAVAAEAPMPLATNLCLIEFEHFPEAIRKNAVRVVLSDHHYWGGLRASKYLARICKAAGMGLSMHSNSHLGISLAAMTHLAASTPHLEYDCDTHYPWTDVDLIKGGKREFSAGTLAVSEEPGLGVELDHDMLAELNALYESAGVTDRDDTLEMKKYDPGYVRKVPRW